MKNILISILICVTFCCACENEQPFNEVIKHYSIDSKDSLKLRAARFLIKNAQYHSGVPNYLVDRDGNRVSDVDPWSFKIDTVYKNWLDSMGYRFQMEERLPDLEVLTPDYLIENIELAFMAWEKPWARHIGFEEFCEYILPYRAKDEMLTDYRRYFFNEYAQILEDSVEQNHSPLEVAKYYVNLLQKRVTYATAFRNVYRNYLCPEEFEKMRFAECDALAHYGTLVMRSVGLPVSMISINWRFGNMGHATNLLYSNDTVDMYRFAIFDEFQPMGLAKDSMASYRTSRYTFAPNPKDLALFEEDNPNVPLELYTPVCRDEVTSRHCITKDFSLEIPEEWREEKHLYLCRFKDWEWYPIRMGDVDGDRVYFKDATIRQLYRLGRYRFGKTETYNHPFTLTGNGEIEYKYPTEEYETISNAYNCPPTEKELKKVFTTFLWTENQTWEKMEGTGVLWGYNEKTAHYKIFEAGDEKNYTPVFHLVDYHVPCNTVFYDKILDRPRGWRPRSEPDDYNYMVY